MINEGKDQEYLRFGEINGRDLSGSAVNNLGDPKEKGFEET